MHIQDTPDPMAPEQTTKLDPNDPKLKKKNADFRSKIEVCKQYKRKIVPNWSLSIDYRRGKPFSSQSDDEQMTVNMDWPMTKTKQASLFSQIPQVRVSHPFNSGSAGPWLATYETKLNDTLVTTGIEAAMDECLPDCINAAGIGVVVVSRETLTQDKEVPAIDLSILPPELQQRALSSGMIGGQKIPMETVPEVVDWRYLTQRISPSDFLWPINFTGSNFDSATWLGRSGKITWAEAVQKYNVGEADKKDVMGDDETPLDQLNYDTEREKSSNDEMVGFDEIFYKEFAYDSESKSYSTIHHLVFLKGKEDPVVDEAWKGQKIHEDGTVIGSLKFPIRVLALSYITDETIPPSDSAIARASVNELNKLRAQNIKQRERNIPVRWFDVNRTDPAIQQALMKGTWQSMIPVQGDGSRVIGEVAQARMPPDNFSFDQIVKNDIAESWSVGPNQIGSGAGVETRGESEEIASNFQTRLGRERAKVASFFVGISEVLGGLMCLYEDPQSFGEGFDPAFSKNLGFSILADSTVLVDANQKLERLNRFLNVYAKSGFVNLEPVLKEVAILSGLDPNVAIKVPEPQSPPPPNVSVRLSGAEDLMNPLVLAVYLGEGKPPTPKLIKQAMDLIQMSVSVPGLVQPGPPPVDPEGQPEGPPPIPVGQANPEMTVLPKIAKRSDDPGAGGKEPI